MKIRKAVKLANEGKKIRRPGWCSGIRLVVGRYGEIEFYEDGQPVKDVALYYFDILADDWEVVE